MRLMTKATLRAYTDNPRNAAAKVPMDVWAATVRAAKWASIVDVKRTFPATDHLTGEKVCFDVGGNKWRIIASINYEFQTVFLKWIGTHSEYDKL